MKVPDNTQYLTIETYKEAIDVFDNVVTLILFSFAKHSQEVRDVIIGNFIARAIVSVKGIINLYESGNHQDCWILYRCILDRLFHLKHLVIYNQFELFERWSFKQQYDARNKIRSDPEFKTRLNPEFFKDTSKEKERYNNIVNENIDWQRPKAEDIAKEMGLLFLYKYGYDYASSLVHPMANDGQEDFLRQTRLGTHDMQIDNRSVIHNSCLVLVVLIQEGLNNSNYKWRALIYNFLDDFIRLLQNGSKDYLVTFFKIGKLGPDIELCEKRNELL